MKLTSTWAEHCPAYYVALNLQDKIMLISVRGTAQVEDVVTDLTALPKVLFSNRCTIPCLSQCVLQGSCLSERLS